MAITRMAGGVPSFDSTTISPALTFQSVITSAFALTAGPASNDAAKVIRSAWTRAAFGMVVPCGDLLKESMAAVRYIPTSCAAVQRRRASATSDCAATTAGL